MECYTELRIIILQMHIPIYKKQNKQNVEQIKPSTRVYTTWHDLYKILNISQVTLCYIRDQE